MFAGKVSVFNRRLQLAHPAYELLRGDAEDAGESVETWAGALIPIYPATAKLESWKIGKAVQTVLPSAQEALDPLPDSLREGRGLVPLPEALLKIHRPHTKADIEDARARLKWDEAFVLQVALARRRHADAQLPAVPRKPTPDGLLAAFDARLPFTLTDGQQKVSREIFDDLATDHPMHRLLQGEVGSGKTLVALRAMLAVVDAGGQAAMLAPTEVLAQQHHRSIIEMMGELAEGGMLGGAEQATKVVLLTGSMGAAARRQALLDLVTGEAGIVIGTHALIEDKVQFHDLGLVVVDEQHRFGVEQRDALRGKGKQPPAPAGHDRHARFPRTVAMTVFGDLETSVLDQLPAGRSPIASHVVPAADKPHFLARAWERVREEVGNGHQAYVVCPRIGDEEDEPRRRRRRRRPAPEDDGARSARRSPSSTSPTSWPRARCQGLRVEVLHGRMQPDDKDAVMRRFAAGETDVLVATTVIEVGVNVPNATAMVIMDADRFGVSQLHQLRGRVGRGSAAGPLPAGHRDARGEPGPPAAGRGRRHPRRLRALPHRPRTAPRGRRPRPGPVRRPLLPAGARRHRGRGGHRGGPRGGRRGGGRRPGAGPPARRCARRWTPSWTRSGSSTWTRAEDRRARRGAGLRGTTAVPAAEPTATREYP